MRALICFGKRARLRFISHLDLQRFMQRALRRTDLPVAYSQGFNPHPQMAFASALAMGWVSEYEILDVKMAQEVTAEHVREQMSAALPKDLPVFSVRMVEDRHPAMMAMLTMADYEIRLSGEDGQRILRAIPGFLAETSVMAMRKTKSGEKPCDIRPMAIDLRGEGLADGALICARLALTEQATLKPDLLIKVLSERAGLSETPRAQVLRKALLTGGGAAAKPLMEA